MDFSDAILERLEALAGWLYFFAWSISFYPQMYLNFKRRSVIGLSLDYTAVSIVGFSSYTIFTTILYWNSDVRDIFRAHNNGEAPQVELNDVIFALHGIVCCLITGLQCILYPRGNQTVIRPIAFACTLVGLVLIFGFACAWLGALDWLLYMRFCGLIKFLSAFTKYQPQVLLNYRRKSTEGFSFSSVFLDFVGGVLSVVQQAFRAVRQRGLSPFTKNLAKTGLGIESLMFNVIFIVQHLLIYGPVAPIEDEGVPSPEKVQLMSEEANEELHGTDP